MEFRSYRGASRLFCALVDVLAICYFFVLLYSATRETQTNDESAHIVAGYSYWIQHDYRLNPEHPPLSKLFATLPLIFLQPPFPNDPKAWSETDEFRLGEELLYGPPPRVQSILLACRSMTALFAVSFAVFLAFWARRLFSEKVALLVFLFLLLDPNFAAHARYVTSDVYVSAFFFLTCMFWYEWLATGRRRELVFTSLALGLAVGSKFNALLLVPVLFLLWLLQRWPMQRWRKPALPSPRAAAVLLLIPFGILLLLYQGDTRSVASDPLIRSRLAVKGQQASAWERIPVPAYYWFRGVQLLSRHQITGHLSYLMGRMSYAGFLAYFPMAFLLKTASGTLLAFIAAIVASVLLRRGVPAVLLLPPALYFAVAMLSRVDIGVRHILLVYPFLYVFFGWLMERLPNRRLGEIAACVALLINLVEFVRVYPNQIAFFNTPSGGPSQGPRYLLDSNVDWGQGLLQLREAVAARRHSCLALQYFGRALPEYYVGPVVPVPASAAGAKAQGCLIAISAQYLYGDPQHRHDYLRAFPPVARPSYSIYLYDPKQF